MTFDEWEKTYQRRGVNPACPDFDLDDLRAAWNVAVEEAAKYTLAYAQRHHDIRRAALEVCAEQLRSELRSPRVCDVCGQPKTGGGA